MKKIDDLEENIFRELMSIMDEKVMKAHELFTVQILFSNVLYMLRSFVKKDGGDKN